MKPDPDTEGDRSSRTPVADWISGGQAKTLVLLLATAWGLYLCYRLALPFLPALAWAVGLSVLAWHLLRRAEPTLADWL